MVSRNSINSGSAINLLFPMDALDRATVDGFLDLLPGCPGRVVNFRQVLIVQAEDFRTDFFAKPAGNTIILLNIR